MIYTLQRHGSFYVHFTGTDNQCGSERQTAYQYHCELKVQGELDEHGFVLDNENVQTYFKQTYGRRQPALSCERIAERAVRDILYQLEDSGRDVLSVSVRIWGSAEASLTAEWRKGDAIEQPTNDNERESELWTVA